MTEMPVYKKKDFVSDQDVRWCPGCGDYAILSSVQVAMTKIGKKKEDIVFVSGIGCSSRFPYYMDTYGMHTIHGRAPAFATGVKLQNPHLEVWNITGDGDGLSIGGNHLIHAIRRNVDINVILFNNEIYGLTKGQFSPTSRKGLVTKSTPFGSVDKPFNIVELIMGAGASFYARTIDTDPKHMTDIFIEASKHKGTSFIEIFQNCIIFNDKVHDDYTNRNTRDDHTLRLENGRPLVFGKEKKRAICLEGLTPKIIDIIDDKIPENVLVHDPANKFFSNLLAQFDGVDLPMPLGILKSVEISSFDHDFHKQLQKFENKEAKFQDFLYSGETWEV